MYLLLFPIDQYMAFGISGSNTSTDMVGADVIVVWVKDGVANAVDYLLTARQQVNQKPFLPYVSIHVTIVTVSQWQWGLSRYHGNRRWGD